VRPYFKEGLVTIYHGDCRKILPRLKLSADVVLSDPPYGIGLATDYAERFSPSQKGSWWRNTDRSKCPRHKLIAGDDEPFDPAPLFSIKSRAYILWGANCYCGRLPDSGGWFLWDKRNGKRDVSGSKWPMGEGELAWTNLGKAVRIFRHTWFGLIRDSEAGEHYHSTQKPVALMGWCLDRAKATGLVVDPYMGSGSVLIAARDRGLPVIGIDLDKENCDVAIARLSQGTLRI
jgi:site-specific DNA-methyltransferase (adenine-specific)